MCSPLPHTLWFSLFTLLLVTKHLKEALWRLLSTVYVQFDRTEFGPCIIIVFFLHSILGTYNNLTHRTSQLDCELCPGGEYCDRSGLDLPTGKCSAGYYCTQGSNSSTPSQGLDADICPQGFYCPEGTAMPQSCPLGTYNSAVGRQNVSECTACSGGRYCPYYNATSPGPLCQPGETLITLFFTSF